MLKITLVILAYVSRLETMLSILNRISIMKLDKEKVEENPAYSSLRFYFNPNFWYVIQSQFIKCSFALALSFVTICFRNQAIVKTNEFNLIPKHIAITLRLQFCHLQLVSQSAIDIALKFLWWHYANMCYLCGKQFNMKKFDITWRAENHKKQL